MAHQRRGITQRDRHAPRRASDQGRLCSPRAAVSVADHGADRLLARARDALVSSATSASASSSPARSWTPQLAGDQQSFGLIPLLVGTLYLTAHRHGRRDPARPAVGDLSGRVRAPARAQDRQADPRGARGRADDRLRFLRADLRDAGDPARSLRPRGLAPSTSSRPASSSASSCCRRSRRSPRTRCPRCRRRCARAPSGSAPTTPRGAAVVFPAALSGIVAGLVLGASRAIGETLVILLAGGSGQLLPNIVWDATRVGRLDGLLHRLDRDRRRPDRARSSTRRSSPSASRCSSSRCVLNLISIRLVNRFRQVYE